MRRLPQNFHALKPRVARVVALQLAVDDMTSLVSHGIDRVNYLRSSFPGYAGGLLTTTTWTFKCGLETY